MNNDHNSKKYIIFVGIIIIVFFTYFFQLVNLQLINTDYEKFAKKNAYLNKTVYPHRGIISDRHGSLLVTNQPTYDLSFIPREIGVFDTIELCNLLNIDIPELNDKFEKLKYLKNGKKNPGYSTYTIQTLISQINEKDAAFIQEKLYKFPGFFMQERTVRKYLHQNAGLLLGYTAEVNATELENDKFYSRADYIGKSGIEKSYENFLRGEKGSEILLRDAHGRIQGKFENGYFDIEAISGKALQLTLDINLQAYGEELMKNKTGCIIMIEPSTGEIITLVSAPSYDPSLLLGSEFGENYKELQNNPYKPLINRATQGVYPPGSTFKALQALVLLQEEAINLTVSYPCHGGYGPMGGKPKCHPHSSPVSIIPALATSCNAFFPYGLTNLLTNRKKYENINKAFDVWFDHMTSMGFGRKLNTDLPFESQAFIPTSSFYSKAFKTEDWKPTYVISTAIGQGEISATPLQMANAVASIANRGFFYTPHLVKSIQDTIIDQRFSVKNRTTIDPIHYDAVIEGMHRSVTGGTSRGANIGIDIEVCGKTGTSENPHGKDHSLFMAFAPKEKPEVAIFVLVENAGFGATYAVPIARLMLQKYFRNEIPKSDKWIEDRILNANLSVLPK